MIQTQLHYHSSSYHHHLSYRHLLLLFLLLNCIIYSGIQTFYLIPSCTISCTTVFEIIIDHLKPIHTVVFGSILSFLSLFYHHKYFCSIIVVVYAVPSLATIIKQQHRLPSRNELGSQPRSLQIQSLGYIHIFKVKISLGMAYTRM